MPSTSTLTQAHELLHGREMEAHIADTFCYVEESHMSRRTKGAFFVDVNV